MLKLIKDGWKYLTIQKWAHSIKENLVILAEFMLCCPETNAVNKNLWTNEKSRFNIDILAFKIQCGELAKKFNIKDISCSEISNILFENDILIKNIYSMTNIHLIK